MATGIQISPPSDITVGTTAISNGTEGRVLFQAGGVVQQDANFTFDNTLKRLALKAVGTAGTDIPFRVRNSADTADLFILNGNKAFNLGGGVIGDGFATYLGSQTGVTQITAAGNSLNLYAAWNINSNAVNQQSWQTNSVTRIHLDVGGNVGIGSATTLGARLDVRAQGALSTDLALRVRNSADSANILEQRGDSNLILTGVAPRMTYASANNGGSISHHPRGDSAINLKHSFTFFQSGFSDGSQGTAPKLNMICADITNYGMNNGFHWYFNNNLNPLDSERALWLTPKKTLSIFTGTGPDAYTAKVDSFQLYSADIVAGNAVPHFRTENGSIIKLFQGAALTASDGTLANAVTRIAEIQARLQAHGLIA
jgi:hypothetical protein